MTDLSATPSEVFLPVDGEPLDIRLRMLANDYVPLPATKKAVFLPDWSNITVNEQSIGEWEPRWGSNTSVRTTFTPVIDIDIRHEAAARLVEGIVRQHLQDRGVVLVRIGQAPKRAIVTRALVPFPKMHHMLVEPDGKTKHKIEILASGQQLVVAGIHPDTQAPYTWLDGRSPVNTPRAHVPPISEGDAAEILAACVRHLKDELGWLDTSAEVVTLVPDGMPLPLNERLAATEYQGAHGLNDAILAMTADRISSGISVKDVIEECFQFVKGVWDKMPDEHADKAAWNWNAQRNQITEACYGFYQKGVRQPAAYYRYAS
jgi:hypothetical protein